MEKEISSDVMDVTDKELVTFTKPLKVQAKIERIGDTVLANTTISTHYHAFCYRCLNDIEKDWSQNLLLDFPAQQSTEFIDLGEGIRQELILAMPTRMLCKENCNGICPQCGANLNNEKCKCK